jgi:hypothetical protein
MKEEGWRILSCRKHIESLFPDHQWRSGPHRCFRQPKSGGDRKQCDLHRERFCCARLPRWLCQLHGWQLTAWAASTAYRPGSCHPQHKFAGRRNSLDHRLVCGNGKLSARCLRSHAGDDRAVHWRLFRSRFSGGEKCVSGGIGQLRCERRSQRRLSPSSHFVLHRASGVNYLRLQPSFSFQWQRCFQSCYPEHTSAQAGLRERSVTPPLGDGLGTGLVTSLALLVLPRRLRRRVSWLALLIVFFALSVSGCGGPGELAGGTPPGTYHVGIAAAVSQDGQTLSHSTTVTLTVKSLF